MGIRYTTNAKVQQGLLRLTDFDIVNLIGNHDHIEVDPGSGLIAVLGTANERRYRLVYRLIGEDLLIVNIAPGGTA